MPVYADNSETIGRTPLVRINRITTASRPPSWPKLKAETPPTASSAASAPP